MRLLFKGNFAYLACVIGLIACSEPQLPNTNQHVANQQSHSLSLNASEILAKADIDETQLPKQLKGLIIQVNSHITTLFENAILLNQDMLSFAQHPQQDKHQALTERLRELHARFSSAYILDDLLGLYTLNKTTDGAMGSIAGKVSLDQFPLLPGYLDALEDYPQSGLVFSDIAISREQMEQEFQLGDPAYVTLGFHALDVILNGAAGQRKVSAFAKLEPILDTSLAEPELRRTLYALLLTQEIMNDLGQLVTQWIEIKRPQLASLSEEDSQTLIATVRQKASEKLKQTPAEGQHLSKPALDLQHTLLNTLSKLE